MRSDHGLLLVGQGPSGPSFRKCGRLGLLLGHRHQDGDQRAGSSAAVEGEGRRWAQAGAGAGLHCSLNKGLLQLHGSPEME